MWKLWIQFVIIIGAGSLEKSMPPSGALGVTMDDDALIEAEIAQQLDQINLEADDFQFDENEVDFQDDDLDFPLEDQEVVICRGKK